MMKFNQFTSFILVVFSGLFVLSCGQINTKDEGLDSKTIEEASGTSDTTTDITTTDNSTTDNSTTDNSSSSLPSFVVVGDSGAILTSSDGTTWNNKSLSNGPSFTAITSGNNILLVAGSTGVVTSTDGSTWTSRNPGFTPEPHTLRFGKNLFVMTSSTDLYSSPDGITWTKRHTPSNVSHIMGISFTNDTFFVYSDNLSHSHTNPASMSYFYSSGRVNCKGNLAISTDGLSWSDVSWGLKPISTISYLNDRYIAVGGADCITFFVTSSTGGTTWTTKTYSGGGSAVAEYLAVGNSTFVTVGGYRPSGNIVVTSGNGNSWTSTTTFLSGENNRNPSGLIFENNIFVSHDGFGGIGWSDNGSNWSQATLAGLGAGNTLKDLIHANNLMLAVGESGAILISSDGKTWSGQSSGTSANLNKAWGSGTMKN